MSKSPLHQAALDYAAKGWAIFPCLPGAKKPATEHGFHDASVDPTVIDAWWTENPNYNIAFSPHTVGLGIVDIDGTEGEANWLALECEHGLPATYELQTPRGGRHLYYKGELPPTQSKIAVHIDTRGRGSYALLPPSRTEDGEYRVLVDVPLAELPAWIPARIAAAKKSEIAKASVEALDLPANVARAVSYLKTAPPAIEGQMGDQRTYVVACDVLNLGVSPELAAELMLEHFNPRCEPPWEPGEIETKIANAASYAQNEPGAWAVEPAQDTFKEALGKLLLEPAPARRFPLLTLAQVRALPTPEWLVKDMIPEKSFSLWYGPPESFKSFLALQMALEVASADHPVVYIGAEGSRGLEQRASAWLAAHERTEDPPLRFSPEMPWAANQQMIDDWITETLEQAPAPAMVVVDTAAYMLTGLNENDAKDVGLFVAALAHIRKRMNCAILIVHHSGKEASKGARGSSALLGAVDTAWEVQRDADTTAVAVWCRKMKDADKPKHPWCYEGKAFGGSLVFQSITEQEYRALTQTDDLLSSRRIGGHLMSMNAKGEDNGVTTMALAQTIIQAGGDEPEDMDAAAGRLTGVLQRLGRTKLEAYCSGSGAGLRWWLPISA